MKRISYIIAIVISLSLGFNSCKEEQFFELERPSVAPWQTLAQLNLGVNAAYQQMYTSQSNEKLFSTWYSALAFFNMYDFMASDMCQIVPEAIQGDQAILNMFYDRNLRIGAEANPYGKVFFTQLYRSITASSGVLNFLEQAGDKKLFPEVSDAEYNDKIPKIKADMYMMRAYAYWYLVQFYCPPYIKGMTNNYKILPIKRVVPVDASIITETELGSSNDIYKLIIEDLTKAKSLFPKDYMPIGRGNYWAACGYLMRVYFAMGDFDKALNESEEIVASNKFKINEDPIKAFSCGYNETSPELLFQTLVGPSSAGVVGWEQQNFWISKVGVAGRSASALNGGRARLIEPKASNIIGDYTEVTVSNSMLKYVDWMKTINGQDVITNEALSDKRFQQTYWYCMPYREYKNRPLGMDSLTWLNSYATWTGTGSLRFRKAERPLVFLDKYDRAEKCYQSCTPLLRYAEVLLTDAILNFRKGGDGIEKARGDINQIRQRAGLSPIPAGGLTEDIIHKERIKELTGEGDRLRYLIALGLPIPKGDNPNATEIASPYSNWFFNIPIEEINSNSAFPIGYSQ